MTEKPVLRTPDGKYLVVRGRLWRVSNPNLPDGARSELTNQLMAARREVRSALAAGDATRLKTARLAVNTVKVALGERGEVWWTDGSLDFNRFLVKNTHYAAWYASSGLA